MFRSGVTQKNLVVVAVYAGDVLGPLEVEG